jgi:hypothetical protein
MIDGSDWRRRGALALRRVRPVFERHAQVCAKMNEQLAALAVALAIIVSLTAACRAPAFLADRHEARNATQMLE